MLFYTLAITQYICILDDRIMSTIYVHAYYIKYTYVYTLCIYVY